MNGLTLQVYNWLKELEEEKAAELVSKCEIDNRYIDTLFSMSDETQTDMFSVTIFIPLKLQRQLDNYAAEITAIESAITESAETDGVYVRDIDWKPFLKTPQESNNDKKTEAISEILTQDYVNKQIRLMNGSVQSNPHLALGISKELIETCCKHILNEENISFEKDWDILKLVKETNKAIDLVPFETENKELTQSSIAKILGGFSNIVHGITELRNTFGTGHGHSPDFKMLDELYIKLSVGASSELALFYLTLLDMKKKNDNINKDYD